MAADFMTDAREADPLYAIVAFDDVEVYILGQGSTSRTSFGLHFVEPYDLEGERYRPGEGAVVRGALLASDASTMVTVTIWAWALEDGSTRWLCQATDDGRPPSFVRLASSRQDLVASIIAALA